MREMRSFTVLKVSYLHRHFVRLIDGLGGILLILVAGFLDREIDLLPLSRGAAGNYGMFHTK